MFEFDPRASYMMPAHFGPRPLSPKASGWYRDVTSMVVPFVTDADKLAAYLPRQFSVADQAIVNVTYACNRNIDWLAGHGYNLIAVSAAVEYEGEEDTLSGNYALVMWENLADPILTGRELQGIPKIYADIQDHNVIAGDWNSSASHFGHKIVDISVGDLREPSAEEILAYEEKAKRGDHPLAWRYFPGVSGFGHSVSEYTTFPSDTTLTEVQVGTGRVDWQTLTWEQNPTQFHIVNALAALPVLEWLPAMVAKGSTNLIIPDRLPRVVR